MTRPKSSKEGNEKNSLTEQNVTGKTPPRQNVLSSLLYFLETLRLFTLSDIKTFVVPETAFGLFGALSGPAMTTTTTSGPATADLWTILSRLPSVVLWTWLNTLLFTLSNQRLPDAVKEDSINKPHRPIAAGRISSAQTTRLLLVGIPVVLGVSVLWLGGAEETALLTCLNWMYNELGGSEGYVERNLLLAATYAAYCSGAVRVATASSSFPFSSSSSSMMMDLHDDAIITITTTTLHRAAYEWIAIIATVIFTTMQVQDLKDQDGDRARGRRTLPLALGDGPARWSVAIPVLVWSVVCPAFWSLQGGWWLGFAVPVALGLVVAGRVLFWRTGKGGGRVAADRTTWKWWSLWLSVLYLLPVCKNQEVLVEGLKWVWDGIGLIDR